MFLEKDYHDFSSLSKWMLKKVLRDEDNVRTGDFCEIYNDYYEEKGIFRARLFFLHYVLMTLPAFIMNFILWSLIMFKNYLKIAVRNVMKYKTFSFINIFNLAIGLAGCILISLFVIHEYSYDKFHENADKIYRIEQDQIQASKTVPFHVAVTAHPLAPAIKEEIPEIKFAARYAWAGRFIVKYKDKSFSEYSLRGVDPSFLEMFTFPFIEGDKSSALKNPNSIVISKEMAEKYFADESPMGKTLSLNKNNDAMVTGVFKNVPSNSSIRFDMLVPYKFLEINDLVRKNWSNNMLTFVILHENSSILSVNKKISDLRYRRVEALIQENNPKNLERFRNSKRTEFELKPLTGIRLNSYFGYDRSLNSNRYSIRLFSVVAFILLLTACINFMNLSTARSTLRAKEIGMRKVVGALRINIIKQFFTESVVFSVFSLVIALLLVQLFIPKFNTLARTNLSFDLSANLNFLIIISLITIAAGMAAGSYPAFFLASFKPVSTLKGTVKKGAGAPFFRNLLVIFQFVVFAVFLVGTITVNKQLAHLKSGDTGFDRDQFAYIRLRGETRNIYSSLKNELIKGSQILGVTGSGQLPFSNYADNTYSEWEGKETEDKIVFGMNWIQHDFLKTMGIEVIKGEDFFKKYRGSSDRFILINEEAEKVMNVGSAVGKRLGRADRANTIIGVVKNYNYKSLDERIGPHVLYLMQNPPDYAIIKIQKDNVTSTVKFIESVWEKLVPYEPFEFRFFSESMESMYVSQERLGDIFKYFSILVAIIASLGLFGLTLFTLERRTREIGIRKVLGLSVPGVVWILIKELIVRVVFATIISVPVSYYLMSKWLEDYAYRIDVSWGIFTFAGIIALAVTLMTVFYQSIKAAKANPVDSLRCD